MLIALFSLMMAPAAVGTSTAAVQTSTPAATPSLAVEPAKPAKPAPPQPALSAPPPVRTTTLAAGKEGAAPNGWFQPGVLLQGWFVASAADNTTTTFRLRRGELRVKGEIVRNQIYYEVMVDAARVLEPKDTNVTVSNQTPPPAMGAMPEQVTVKQPASPLSAMQDLFITFKTDFVDASIGQFKIPVGWESYNSSAKILFPERSIVSTNLADRRDLGLRLTKTFKDYHFMYSVGFFNGAGLDNLDNNNAKDGALRLEYYPVEGMTIAGVVYATLWDRDQPTAKDRYEADFRYETGPFLVQSEYIRSRDVGNNGTPVHGQGFYAALAYKLLPELQPCVRFGYFDPDDDKDLDPAMSGGRDEVWFYEGNINYYFQGHEAKVQLSYSRFQFDQKTAQNDVIFAAQLFF